MDGPSGPTENPEIGQLGEADVDGADVEQVVVGPDVTPDLTLDVDLDVSLDVEGPILLGSLILGSSLPTLSPPAMVFWSSSSLRMPLLASLATSPSLFSEGAKDRNDSIDISQGSTSEDDISGEDMDDCELIGDNMGLDMGGDNVSSDGDEDGDGDGDEDALSEVSKEHMVSAALNKVLALSSALNQAIEELKDITGP